VGSESTGTGERLRRDRCRCSHASVSLPGPGLGRKRRRAPVARPVYALAGYESYITLESAERNMNRIRAPERRTPTNRTTCRNSSSVLENSTGREWMDGTRCVGRT